MLTAIMLNQHLVSSFKTIFLFGDQGISEDIARKYYILDHRNLAHMIKKNKRGLVYFGWNLVQRFQNILLL